MILTRSSFFQRLRWAVWLPFYLITFAVLERIPFSHLYDTKLAIDRWIPFREEFVIFYCLWYPLLIGTGLYLLFRDEPAYRRYMRFLAITFFASALIWLIFPSMQSLRPAVMPRHNVFTTLISGLYTIDTCTNVFPSVHVVGSMGIMLAIWDSPMGRKSAAVRVVIAVIAALISLSTVMIKQHAFVDILAGLLLSFLVWLFVYAPVSRSARAPKST